MPDNGLWNAREFRRRLYLVVVNKRDTRTSFGESRMDVIVALTWQSGDGLRTVQGVSVAGTKRSRRIAMRIAFIRARNAMVEELAREFAGVDG